MAKKHACPPGSSSLRDRAWQIEVRNPNADPISRSSCYPLSPLRGRGQGEGVFGLSNRLFVSVIVIFGGTLEGCGRPEATRTPVDADQHVAAARPPDAGARPARVELPPDRSPGPEPGSGSEARSPAVPSASGSLRPTGKSVAAGSSRGVLECTFDDLRFPMEKGQAFTRSMLTPEIETLGGRRIRIRGYILPSFQQRGLTQFVLVRDNMECCFGPGAALYDCLLVEMIEGRSTDFAIHPVVVEGTFSVRELVGPQGKHLAIYHLQGESVTQ